MIGLAYVSAARPVSEAHGGFDDYINSTVHIAMKNRNQYKNPES